MSDDHAPQSKFMLSLITALGLGGGSGAAVSYYVQEAQAKAIEKLELSVPRIEQSIYNELREMNTRLSRIEGRLEGR
jgi:hypothetical protein